MDLRITGWGGRIRTSAWRNPNPLPYHLATPQHVRVTHMGSCERADHKARLLRLQPGPRIFLKGLCKEGERGCVSPLEASAARDYKTPIPRQAGVGV